LATLRILDGRQEILPELRGVNAMIFEKLEERLTGAGISLGTALGIG
jgi:hypothetical protein